MENVGSQFHSLRQRLPVQPFLRFRLTARREPPSQIILRIAPPLGFTPASHSRLGSGTYRAEAMLASCFTENATAHYHTGFKTEVLLETAGGIARFLLERTAVYAKTNHPTSNMQIRLSGDTATVAMHAIAHCIVAADTRILVRGNRYEDDIARGSDGWRTQRRTHIPQWQYEVQGVPQAIARRDRDGVADEPRVHFRRRML